MTAPTAIVGFVNNLGQHRVLRGIRTKRIWQLAKASPYLICIIDINFRRIYLDTLLDMYELYVD